MAKRKLNLKLKKGALRDYMLRNYCSKAFRSRGTIKEEYLKKAVKEGNAHTKKWPYSHSTQGNEDEIQYLS